MKKIVNQIVIVLAVGSLFFASGCKKGGGEPSPSDITSQQLISATWKVSTVTVDGTNQTALFDTMTLKFTATSYTTTNGGVVWPAGGTWAFVNENATTIKRDDGVEVALSDVSESGFKMTLVWNKRTLGSGRVSSVAGTHVFTMVKQ
jgi:hypothetical protein